MQESCGLEARAYPSPQARASPSPPLSLPPTPKPAMSHIHPSPPLSSPSLPPPPSHPLPFPPPPTSRLNLHALSTCQFLLLYRFSPFLFSFFLFSFNLSCYFSRSSAPLLRRTEGRRAHLFFFRGKRGYLPFFLFFFSEEKEKISPIDQP